MGYKSQKVSLKYFNVTLLNDIFKYYKDGIYHITKEEYIKFNYGQGIHISFRREIDYVIMLKRQGIYMFLLENREEQTLTLLNGGLTNKLKIFDVNYYYKNMVKYSEYVKTGMKEYNEVLKWISNAVKKMAVSEEFTDVLLILTLSENLNIAQGIITYI